MEINEIKKVLYKEKPIARTNVNLSHNGETVAKSYLATGSLGDHYFKVPLSEMGETPFEDEMPAQLLIRWLEKK